MTGRQRSGPLRVALRALRAGPVRRVLVAYLVFNTAEWATWIAVLVWAFDRGGAGAAALIAVVQLVPSAVVAPVASALGDRLPRGRALALGYAAQGATMLVTTAALLADAPFATVASAAALASCTVTLTRPVHGAVLPDIAETPDELVAGYSASTTVEGAAAFAGPAVAALLLTASEAWSVYLAMGVASLGSALLTWGLAVHGSPRRERGAHLLAETLVGLRAVGHDPGAVFLVVLVGAQHAVVGLMDILVVVLAIDVLGLGQGGPGALTSALGVGALIGGAATMVLVGRRRLSPALLVGILATGLPVAVMGFTDVALVAALLMGVYGAGKAFVDVAGRTLLQRTVPDTVLARIFGLQESMMMVGLAVGSLAAPALVAAFGARGSFVVSGTLLPAFGLLAWSQIRRLDRRGVIPGEAYDRLAALPLFAALPQRALEQLARAVVPVEVSAGRDVVREGDEGERFYVVRAGDLAVTRVGLHVRALGPGDSFGEIALLREIPRTATVTATSDVVLDAVDRDAFLSAVTGVPSVHRAADERVGLMLEADEADDVG